MGADTVIEMARYSNFWRALREDAKDIGIAILGLAILFGFSVAVALIFHYG